MNVNKPGVLFMDKAIMRARIVDGDRFIALAHQDQCQGCRREFENA